MKRIIVLMSSLIILCGMARAQIANDGGVLGVVTDPSGAVIAGAEATAKNIDTGFTKVAISNDITSTY